jgi:hypothetical protein
MELTARALLRWFDVDIATDLDEDHAIELLHYADLQEQPSLARLALLRFMWRRLGVIR